MLVLWVLLSIINLGLIAWAVENAKSRSVSIDYTGVGKLCMFGIVMAPFCSALAVLYLYSIYATREY